MDIWRNNVIMLIFIALKKYFIIFITRRDWNMHERSLGWIYTPRKSEVIIYRRLNVKQWIISQKIGPLERSWGETKSCTKKKNHANMRSEWPRRRIHTLALIHMRFTCKRKKFREVLNSTKKDCSVHIY